MIKTRPLVIRVTEDELAHLEEAGIRLFGRPNKSRLMRKLLRDYIGMGPDLTDEEMTAFREAIRQLTGMARNLNQITARMNSDNKQNSPLSPEYIKRLSSLVRQVNEQLKGYVSHTVNRYQEVVNHGNRS